MKKIVFLVVAFFTVATVFAQKSPLQFNETKYSFGKVKQHVPVTHKFSFKNTSAERVLIEKAEAGCGCTTPEYPKQPIEPGKTGEIKVTFNAEAPNTFTKQVTVKLAKINDPIILTIDGDVVPEAAKTTKTTKVTTKTTKPVKKA